MGTRRGAPLESSRGSRGCFGMGKAMRHGRRRRKGAKRTMMRGVLRVASRGWKKSKVVGWLIGRILLECV